MEKISWVLDGHGFAHKVRNARLNNWRSDASIECPECNYKISNAHVSEEWPGFPAGVKFDPSDQELIEHLAAKVGVGDVEAHAYIDEFIVTLDGNNGICYTHPENLPGVKRDGSSIHFFHKTMKAYTTGARKRRKIASDVNGGGEVRWHKTGKTRPVIENGIQKGCKKIMVLYISVKGSKDEKTNWVMHQYHLGTEEDETDGEFVVSKVFYQQQGKQCDKSDPYIAQDDVGASTSKGDPRTPKTFTPLPPRSQPHDGLNVIEEEQVPQAVSLHATICSQSKEDDIEFDSYKDILNAAFDENNIWPPAGESQFLEDSQEPMNGPLFCTELFENEDCQQSVDVNNSMLWLSECGRIVNNESELFEESVVGPTNPVPESCEECVEALNSVPKSCEESLEAKNNMDGLSKCGDSRNSEPVKEELDIEIDPVLENIDLDTPPDGATFSQFSFSQEQDSDSIMAWLNSLPDSLSQGSK